LIGCKHNAATFCGFDGMWNVPHRVLSLTWTQQALARLRTYVPPPTIWQNLPLSRRAAVLILLFADPKGDLRVVLTMRASTLKSYSGQAALPGGHGEDGETAFQTARREAEEEIGLPADDSKLPTPFKVEHLCEIPTNLAKTELAVRPCVGFLQSHDEATGQDANVAETLIPRLNAKEVAAVFSAPFRNFLYPEDEPGQKNLPGKPSDWYQGIWTDWYQSRWRMHNFFVPVTNQFVSKPKKSEELQMAADHLETLERYRVFGMTARILVDVARIAYAQEPAFEYNSRFGDEDMIRRLRKIGRLGELRRPGEELTKEVLKQAAKL
jgi:8-oxo-dGTP pyrophosphatase MutT (NUDIX family)